MSKQEWQEEQQRVDQVTDKISRQINILQQEVGDIQTEVVDIRKNFWDDVTVNFDDVHEAAETYASMKQQAEVLSERERSYQHARERLRTLHRLEQSPYFGRIDFTEEGEQTERIYLGLASFQEENGQEFLVYDWRAPISSLYYDYSPGPAQYQAPSGTISGVMELKRQYVIRDGRILSLFDTVITIGDELLQEVLGRQANTQMKSIVATIQKEQNQIIRNERSRLLLVQGAAGSGKTSAALQRVAYLLYRYRNTLQAEQIVLFSPNQLFNSYISTVLPELGEKNMQQVTFQEYLQRRLGKIFALEDPFMQMEYVLTAEEDPAYDIRMAGIRYKADQAFVAMIEQYAAFLSREGMLFKDITFRGKTLVSAAHMTEQFYKLDAALQIPDRMNLLVEWLLQEIKQAMRKELTEQWVEDEIELLDKEAYLQAYKKLRKKRRYTGDTFDDFEREKKQLAKMVVQERFKPLRRRVKRMRFIDMKAMYERLFADPEYVSHFAPDAVLPEQWADICAQTKERIVRTELAYEDATPYLYLQELVEGFQSNTSIKHVFIDEAQDYSAFQFAFIKRLFPRSKMTVLGDSNQAIYAHARFGIGVSSLSSLYESEQTEKITLTRSYRSTRQIVEFTREFVGGSGEIEPFNREGSKPTVIQVANMEDLAAQVTERIQALQIEGHRTIAVICKTAEESRQAYEALRVALPIRLIGKETGVFETGTLIIPSYLAKGVEFDAVIIYNGSKSQYGRESERKLFYTACTRAMHELYICCSGEMSPFIREASADTYNYISGM
ncbi:DNA helicase-2/ATP-dependent DNA helicase PcrA [Aneurinibacillus soli]|uniref:Helicase IV n=2 Tax=Aneurinibacillus soli TaxID=1500254 RepID=A0A0U4WAL4_9BACL|nr:DNA helicase-2/ATP-dependent DNA helicase PcrA [Aneurinibacillus soli]BAU25963.1 Helicase IV [Aneurinibacillus soli]